MFDLNIVSPDSLTEAPKTNVFAYEFAILKRDYNNVGAEDRAAKKTKELFPGSFGGESSTFGSRRTEPADLCLSRSSVGVEESRVRVLQLLPPPLPAVKKSRRGPRSTSSEYRGVTFYRRTGRWESHIWDCGRQVYIGGFDTAEAAARAYDRAAIKFRGVKADINFNLSDYEQNMQQTNNLNKEEFLHILRRWHRNVSGGSSKHRGETLLKCGLCEAQKGQSSGKKAYDETAITCNRTKAVTNFERITYKNKFMGAGMGEISCNLDLNLRISTPNSNVSTKRAFHHNVDFLNMHGAKIARSDNHSSIMGDQPTYALTMGLKKPCNPQFRS